MSNQPIFPRVPRTNWARLTAPESATDGTGPNTVTVLTAGASGTFVEKAIVKPLGTNGSSVLRMFLNNGSAPSTPANNSLYHEQTLLASVLATNAAMLDYTIAHEFALPGGHRIMAALGATTVGDAGWQVTVIGGDY